MNAAELPHWKQRQHTPMRKANFMKRHADFMRKNKQARRRLENNKTSSPTTTPNNSLRCEEILQKKTPLMFHLSNIWTTFDVFLNRKVRSFSLTLYTMMSWTWEIDRIWFLNKRIFLSCQMKYAVAARTKCATTLTTDRLPEIGLIHSTISSHTGPTPSKCALERINNHTCEGKEHSKNIWLWESGTSLQKGHKHV